MLYRTLSNCSDRKLSVATNEVDGAVDYETFAKFAADENGNYPSDYVQFDDGIVTVTLDLGTIGGTETTPVKFKFNISDTAVNIDSLVLDNSGVWQNPIFYSSSKLVDSKFTFTESDSSVAQSTLFTINPTSLSDLGGDLNESYEVLFPDGISPVITSLLEVDPNNPLSIQTKSNAIFDYETLANLNDPNVVFNNGSVIVKLKIGTVGGKELTDFSVQFNITDTAANISALKVSGYGGVSTPNANLALSVNGDTINTNLFFVESATHGIAGTSFGDNNSSIEGEKITLLTIDSSSLSDLGGGTSETYELSFPANTPSALKDLFEIDPNNHLSVVTKDNANFDYETLAQLNEFNNGLVTVTLNLGTVGGTELTTTKFTFSIGDIKADISSLTASGAIINSGTNVAFDPNSSTINTDITFIESDQSPQSTNLFTIDPAYLSDPGGLGNTETYELSFADGIPKAITDLFEIGSDKLSIVSKSDAVFDYETLSQLEGFNEVDHSVTVALTLATKYGDANVNTDLNFKFIILDEATDHSSITWNDGTPVVFVDNGTIPLFESELDFTEGNGLADGTTKSYQNILLAIDPASLSDLGGGTTETYELSFPSDISPIITDLFELSANKLSITPKNDAVFDYETLSTLASNGTDANGIQTYPDSNVQFNNGIVTVTLNLGTVGGSETSDVKFNFTVNDTAVLSSSISATTGTLGSTYDNSTTVNITEGSILTPILQIDAAQLSDAGGGATNEVFELTLPTDIPSMFASLLSVTSDNLGVTFDGATFDYEAIVPTLTNTDSFSFDSSTGLVTITASLGTVGGVKTTDVPFSFVISDVAPVVGSVTLADGTNQPVSGNAVTAGSVDENIATDILTVPSSPDGDLVITFANGSDINSYFTTTIDATGNVTIATVASVFDFETLSTLDNIDGLSISGNTVTAQLLVGTQDGTATTPLNVSFTVEDIAPVVDLVTLADGNDVEIENVGDIVTAGNIDENTAINILTFPATDGVLEITFADGSDISSYFTTITDSNGNVSVATVANAFDFETLSSLNSVAGLSISGNTVTAQLLVGTQDGTATTPLNFSFTVGDVAPVVNSVTLADGNDVEIENIGDVVNLDSIHETTSTQLLTVPGNSDETLNVTFSDGSDISSYFTTTPDGTGNVTITTTNAFDFETLESLDGIGGLSISNNIVTASLLVGTVGGTATTALNIKFTIEDVPPTLTEVTLAGESTTTSIENVGDTVIIGNIDEAVSTDLLTIPSNPDGDLKITFTDSSDITPYFEIVESNGNLLIKTQPDAFDFETLSDLSDKEGFSVINNSVIVSLLVSTEDGTATTPLNFAFTVGDVGPVVDSVTLADGTTEAVSGNAITAGSVDENTATDILTVPSNPDGVLEINFANGSDISSYFTTTTDGTGNVTIATVANVFDFETLSSLSVDGLTISGNTVTAQLLVGTQDGTATTTLNVSFTVGDVGPAVDSVTLADGTTEAVSGNAVTAGSVDENTATDILTVPSNPDGVLEITLNGSDISSYFTTTTDGTGNVTIATIASVFDFETLATLDNIDGLSISGNTVTAQLLVGTQDGTATTPLNISFTVGDVGPVVGSVTLADGTTETVSGNAVTAGSVDENTATDILTVPSNPDGDLVITLNGSDISSYFTTTTDGTGNVTIATIASVFDFETLATLDNIDGLSISGNTVTAQLLVGTQDGTATTTLNVSFTVGDVGPTVDSVTLADGTTETVSGNAVTAGSVDENTATDILTVPSDPDGDLVITLNGSDISSYFTTTTDGTGNVTIATVASVFDFETLATLDNIDGLSISGNTVTAQLLVGTQDGTATTPLNISFTIGDVGPAVDSVTLADGTTEAVSGNAVTAGSVDENTATDILTVPSDPDGDLVITLNGSDISSYFTTTTDGTGNVTIATVASVFDFETLATLDNIDGLSISGNTVTAQLLVGTQDGSATTTLNVSFTVGDVGPAVDSVTLADGTTEAVSGNAVTAGSVDENTATDILTVPSNPDGDLVITLNGSDISSYFTTTTDGTGNVTIATVASVFDFETLTTLDNIDGLSISGNTVTAQLLVGTQDGSATTTLNVSFTVGDVGPAVDSVTLADGTTEAVSGNAVTAGSVDENTATDILTVPTDPDGDLVITLNGSDISSYFTTTTDGTGNVTIATVASVFDFETLATLDNIDGLSISGNTVTAQLLVGTQDGTATTPLNVSFNINDKLDVTTYTDNGATEHHSFADEVINTGVSLDEGTLASSITLFSFGQSSFDGTTIDLSYIDASSTNSLYSVLGTAFEVVLDDSGNNWLTN